MGISARLGIEFLGSDDGAGGKWSAIYHEFSAGVSLAGDDDLGDELNLIYSRKFGDHYYGGAKYGDYSSGDRSFSRVDSNKF